MSNLVTVRILGLPVSVQALTAAHIDGLQREFDLMAGAGLPAGSVPQRLLDLIVELRGQFASFVDRPAAELEKAIAEGREVIDLEYRVPAAAGDAADRLGRLLDEADQYCLSGRHLVTLVTPPEARRYRQWLLGEFRRQIAGEDPTPWDRFTEPATLVVAPAEPGERDPERGSSSTLRVEGELDLATAGTLLESLRHLRPDASGEVRVDMAGVSFVDSAALSALVAAHTRFAADGIRLRVVVDPRVLRTMELACLDDVLHVETAPDEGGGPSVSPTGGAPPG